MHRVLPRIQPLAAAFATLVLMCAPAATPAQDETYEKPADATAEASPPAEPATQADILTGYTSPATQLLTIARYAAERPECMRVEELPGTAGKAIDGGAPVLVTIAREGAVEPAKRPAVLVVAGLDGSHLVGVEAAIRLIEYASSRTMGEEPDDAPLGDLLTKRALYVIPCMNYRSVRAAHEAPMREWPANRNPADDDRDAFVDEDGPDDLNGDGMITMMRLEDPKGRWRLDNEDSRLMLEARPEKGETGGWVYVAEGRDDDGDGRYNEDGTGGTNLARQWPFQYPWHAADAGLTPVSEEVCRALATFVIERPNIGVVVVLGTTDNLLAAPKGKDHPERMSWPRRPLEEMDSKDTLYLAELGKVWRERVGLKKELEEVKGEGDFADWVYFHRGRLALKSRVWSGEMALALDKAKKLKEKREAAKTDDGATSPTAAADHDENGARNDDDGGGENGAGGEGEVDGAGGRFGEKKDKPDIPDYLRKEREFAKWLDEYAPGRMVPWREVEGVTLDGRRVEVGGFMPFVRTNPPESILTDLLSHQAAFMADLVGRLPEVTIVEPSATHLGGGAFEISFTVRNDGFLPTVLRHGRRSESVMPVWATIDLPNEAFLGGTRRTRLAPLAGSGGAEEVRAVVAPPTGTTSVEIVVNSAYAGEARHTLRLDASATKSTEGGSR